MSSSSAASEEPEVCGICLEDLVGNNNNGNVKEIEVLHMAPGQTSSSPQVPHRFHRECISRWLTQQITNQGENSVWSGNMECPQCNQSVTASIPQLRESVFPSLVIYYGTTAGAVTLSTSMMATIITALIKYVGYLQLRDSLLKPMGAHTGEAPFWADLPLEHICSNITRPSRNLPYAAYCAGEAAAQEMSIGLNESLLLAVLVALYIIIINIILNNYDRIISEPRGPPERRFGGDPTNSNELCIKNKYINICVTVPKEMAGMVNAAMTTLKEFEEHFLTLSTVVKKGGRKTHRKSNIVKKHVKKTRKN